MEFAGWRTEHGPPPGSRAPCAAERSLWSALGGIWQKPKRSRDGCKDAKPWLPVRQAYTHLADPVHRKATPESRALGPGRFHVQLSSLILHSDFVQLQCGIKSCIFNTFAARKILTDRPSVHHILKIR